MKRVRWSWRFYTILISSLLVWSNIQRNTCISQKKRPLGLVLVSVFTKSISISVPFLDSRLFTGNYLVLDLKMNSDWKKFHSCRQSSMSYDFFFFFSLNFTIRYMFFRWGYLQPRTMQLSKVLRDAISKVANSLQQIKHITLVFPSEIPGRVNTIRRSKFNIKNVQFCLKNKTVVLKTV